MEFFEEVPTEEEIMEIQKKIYEGICVGHFLSSWNYDKKDVANWFYVVKIFGNNVKTVWNGQNQEGAMWKGWWTDMYIGTLKIGTKWES